MKQKLMLGLSLCLGIFTTMQAFAEEAAAPAPEWASLHAGFANLDKLTERLSDPQDPQQRAELFQYLYAGASQGYLGVVFGDIDHPQFYPAFAPAFNFMGPNPDNVYYMTPIDDKGVYKISGYRGTVHLIDFNLASGQLLARGTGRLEKTKANYDIDASAHFKKDGAFEVIMSAERPKDYKGDWWPLVSGTTVLFVRELSYEPLKEVDGRITIERLDRPAIKPRQTAEQIMDNLKMVSQWTENWVKFDFDWQKRLVDQGLVNKVVARNINDVGGFTTQIYVEGTFDIGPDEALIFETVIPKKCRYWNVQLTDEKFAAIDILNRQTWLNGRSAKLDRDGKFRAVISAKDPGVPNWLDTAGYRKGEILGRWNTCDSAPNPMVTKVNVADVRKSLPVDTPVVSTEARDDSIRLQRKGLQLRRRW